VSEVEVVGLLRMLSSGGLKNPITVVSGLLLESEDLGGGFDNVDRVGSLGLLIFNIGIQGGHLSSHVSRGLGPHSDVGGVVDNISGLGRGDSVAEVLKKSDHLLASGWSHGVHLDKGSECTDEWEEGRSFFHGSGADFHGDILELTDLKEGGSGRREPSEKPDGLITGVDGLGVIRLPHLISRRLRGNHLLVFINPSPESLSLIHIFFNLTIKVI